MKNPIPSTALPCVIFFRSPTSSHDRKIFIEFGRFGTIHGGLGGFQPLRAVFDGQIQTLHQPALL